MGYWTRVWSLLESKQPWPGFYLPWALWRARRPLGCNKEAARCDCFPVDGKHKAGCPTIGNLGET